MAGVVGKHVDRASFALYVERDLGRDRPAEAAQQSDDVLDEGSVPLIHESVEALAVPQQAKVDPGTERAGHALQRAEGDPVRLATL